MTVDILLLRLLDTYTTKIAKICVLYTYWPVIKYVKNATALFTAMEHWTKRLFVGFWKAGLLAELQATMSWKRRLFAIFEALVPSNLKLHLTFSGFSLWEAPASYIIYITSYQTPSQTSRSCKILWHYHHASLNLRVIWWTDHFVETVSYRFLKYCLI